MTDKEFINYLKTMFSGATTDRQATLNNAVINRLNDIEEKLEVLEILKNNIDTTKSENDDGKTTIHLWSKNTYSDNPILEIYEEDTEIYNAFKRWLEK